MSSARGILIWPVVSCLLGVNVACGGGGDIVDNRTRLTSSGLRNQTGSLSRKLVAPCDYDRVDCTPSNLMGRIFSGGIMLGPLGEEAFNVTLLANEGRLENPSEGIGGELEFDLFNSTLYSGQAAIPGAGEMPEPPVMSRVELNFDYLDAEFSLSGLGIDPVTYTVRTVFVTEATSEDVVGTMYRGDKLIRAESLGMPEFQWCNDTTCGPRETVAGGLLTDAVLASYEFPGQGNPNYAPYVVELDETVTVTHEQISDPNNIWEVDFHLDGAIQFQNTMTSSAAPAVLNAFRLVYAPNRQQQSGPDETQITASLRITPE